MNTAPKSPGIYRITCKANKMLYIGSAVNLFRRWNEHRSELRYNRHGNIKLQRAWNKYGEDAFIHEILELVLLPELLTAREQWWLDKLQPFGHHGFNIERVAGSPLGVKRSPESKAKNRARRLGQKHTAEAIARMSASQRGHPPRVNYKHSLEARAKITQSLYGNTRIAKDFIVTSPDGTEYAVHNLTAFCKERGLERANLSSVARGKAHQHKGWKARYPGAEEPKPKTVSHAYSIGNSYAAKDYIMTSPEGVEHTVRNLRAFCREHNLTVNSLILVVIGKRKHHKGWQARYATDEAPRYIDTGDPRKKTLIVTAPDGTEYIAAGINQFCREHGLSSIGLIHVAQGKFKQHRGWTARYPDAM